MDESKVKFYDGLDFRTLVLSHHEVLHYYKVHKSQYRSLADFVRHHRLSADVATRLENDLKGEVLDD